MIPDRTHLAAVAAMTDAALRNLWITHSYHQLALGLRVIDERNVTWPAYATWASKTAGHYIRGDEVPKRARVLLRGAESRFGSALGRVPGLGRLRREQLASDLARAVLDGVSHNVGVGNHIVFSELAPLFADLYDLVAVDAPDEAALDAAIEGLRPGATEQGGQGLLREAITAYWRARWETDGKRRAELVFAGNGLIGLHEQIRLQEPIAGAIAAPVDQLARRLLDDTDDATDSWLEDMAEAVTRRALRPVGRLVREVVAQTGTRLALRYELPGESLALGSDVPPLPTGLPYPAELDTLITSEALSAAERIDQTWQTLHGSRAADWSDLGDRMDFILDVFRSRQQVPSLFDSPFTEGQIDALRAGELPAGPL